MWKNLREKTKRFLLDTFFPRFCLNCQKEGNYLCEDCKSLLEISEHQYCLCQKPNRIFLAGKCPKCRKKFLSGLYSALPYQNILVKNLIQRFKYEPFIKELAKPLASLIIDYFQLSVNPPDFFYPVSSASNLGAGSNGTDFILIPVPLDRKRLKWRGFNQAEEIGKELSKSLNLPLINDVLIKIKETPPQVELDGKAREENIKGVFLVKNKEKIQKKKVLLVDDVYTTGGTMEETARILKTAGAKEVWGLVATRG